MREMNLACGFLAAASVLSSGVLLGADLTIAERGKPAAYAVVLPADPSPSQAYAAEELVKYVEKTTGVKLSVGAGKAPHAVFLEPGDPALGGDGFRLSVRGDDLHVAGGCRGVLYGVYELLERFAGVEWLASWHEVVPKRDALRVPAGLDETQKPAFASRYPFWCDALNRDFHARLRGNQNLDARHGGNAMRFGKTLGNCHTFETLVPVAEFFDSHPEYFSFFNGGRQRTRSQLCLANPDVQRLVIERVRKAIDDDPEATYFGVSQNDWGGYCECEKCKAIDDEEGSPSGSLVRFVNAVADAIAKSHPGKVIETLAYTYSRHPPKKTKLRPNVIVCLCSIECDFARPFPESPYRQNVDFVRDVEGWAAMSKELYIWDYVVNFSHYAHAFPNVPALQDNLRFFRRNKVSSLFSQGDWTGRHGEFAELKAWLISKWMWNPEQDYGALLDRFFMGYYGKAAPCVRAYFDALNAAETDYWAGGRRPLTVYADVTDSPVDEAFAQKAMKLWREAELAVKDEDPVYLSNVRMSAFSTVYTRFMRESRPLRVTRHGDRLASPEQVRKMAQWLEARMNEAGNIRLAEEKGRNQALVDRVRSAAAGKLRIVTGASVRGDASFFSGGRHVDDPTSTYGRAVQLDFNHYEWSSKFRFSELAYDPDTEYVLRLHLRADLVSGAPDDAEVLWAGCYDDVQAKGFGPGFSLKAKDCSEGWKWYEIGPVKFIDSGYLWIGPGRYDRGKSELSPAHRGVWVDAVEVVRKDGRQAERDRLAGEVERHVAETTGFETALRTKAQAALPDASRIRKGRWTEVWPRVEPGVSLRGDLPLVTNAVEGEIWSDAFEETLRRAGALRIPARSEPYYIDRALVLSPGQSVVATGAEIRMKPGSGACLLRNAHVVGMTDQKSLAIPDVPYDREILVEGGLWFGLRTAREAMNGNADATCPKERPVHGCHGAFVFNHVRGLVIRNATVGGCLTHAFQFSDVHDFLVKDVTVRAPTRDGVHFHGGCDWGVVSGVRGVSWDDFVALNAWDWSHTAPVVGPIHHLLVERVVGQEDGSRAIRLLCGNRKKKDGSGGTVDCGVSDVVLRDLTDIREFKAYDQPNLELGRDKDRSEPIGTLRRIFVHDLLLHTPGQIEIDNHVDGFDVSRVRFAFEPKSDEEAVVVVGPKTAKWGTVEIFSPDEDIAVKGLTVDDVVVEKTGRKIAPEKAVKVSKAGKGRVMFK